VSFDPRIFTDNIPDIAAGFATTIWVWLVGAAMGIVLGFLIAVLRRFGGPLLRWPLRTFVEIIRGVPFLVQLFLLYYGGPFIGIGLDPLPAGVLGLGLYGSAYFSEIFRAGFEAVPKGHREAAACLGLTRAQIIRRIEIPQMLVVIAPALINMVIILTKETAVLSVITVPELTLMVTAIGSKSFAFVEATVILALCYWALVEGTASLGRRLETRLARFMVR
jgi:polar amino acid transport system permease protein